MNRKQDSKSFSKPGPFFGIEFQLRFEKTAAEISNIFITMPSDRIDEAIEVSLRLCGELFGADRSYIFQFSDDGSIKSNTHEWCAYNVRPQKDKLQDMDTGEFLWMLKRVRENGYLYIPSVNELPPAAEKEKNFFLNNNITSLILIALIIEGEMRGFFGFDFPEEKRIWKDEQITLLKVVTGIIAAALARSWAEKELARNEEMFRSISENAFDMIALLDRNGCYLYCNSSYQKILGYEPQQLIGKSAFDLVHPAEANRLSRLFTEGIENKAEKKALLTRLICSDGSFKWIEHRLKLLFPAEGEPEKILLIAQDVSARKRAEEQLLAQRNLGLKLAATTDLKKALEYCLETALQVSQMDSGGIYLVDEEAGSLKLLCHKGLSSDFFESKSCFNADSWQAGLVQEGKPKYIYEPQNLPGGEAHAREGLTVFAVLPINYENKAVACMNIASHSLTGISGNIRAALETIASQVSSAIARIKAEQAFQDSMEKYQTLVSNVPGIIFSCKQDKDWTMEHMSGDVEEITGYRATDFICNRVRSFGSIMHPEDRDYVYNIIVGHQFKNYPYHVRYRIFTANGATRWVRESGRTIINRESLAGRIDGVIIDITDLKNYEEQLKYLSLHDQLTGLYNRTFFETELSRLEGGREYPVSIISTDLDGLKLINDTLGHSDGDRLLKACAGILQQSFRSSDILARVGGDEFAAILPNTDNKTCESVARRIRDNIAAYNREYANLPLSLSMGVATASSRKNSLRDLFKQADDLMYRDKLYSSFSTRGKIVNSLMSALAERDYITEGHAMRLEKYCLALGEEIGLSSQHLADLALLAQVHDLGKVGIPDRLLFKPGPLDKTEWEIMKLHPEKGYRIALSSPELAGVADLILKHHERWDGTGYPLGLKEEEIPVCCRILAIVDAYDAMIHDRPYKKAITVHEARKEVRRSAGTQFDPHLVEVFLKLPEL